MSAARFLALVALVALAAIAGSASARSGAPWDGNYVGFDIGDGSRSSCSDWALKGPGISAGTAGAFNNSTCLSGGSGIGGLRVGDNFQYKRFVWGLDADFDYWSAGTLRQTVTYAGSVPSGKYAYVSRENPDAFLLVGPRIGYGGDTWFPYLTVGGLLAAGPRTSEVTYTATGAKTPSASFDAAKSFASTGWAAGGGVEIGLNGAWSISAEYLHATFGKGSNASTDCTGTSAACAAFSAISLDSTHGAFSSTIFRVGVIYYFDYWNI
jgi:opacity protein-like surface antigen